MSDGGVYRVPVHDNMEYVNYLMSIEDRWPEYTYFREYLEANSKGDLWYQEDGVTGHVQLHDTLSDNSILLPLSFKTDENSDIQEMENIISNPPASLRSRLIIVVGLDHGKIVNQGVLDLLRLSFDIEPAFFWSLLSTRESQVIIPRLRGFLRMDYMTLKILRNCPSASGDVSVGRSPFENRLHNRADVDNLAVIAIDEWSLRWQLKTGFRKLDPFLFTLHEQPGLNDRENPRIKLNSRKDFDLFQTFSSLLGIQQTVSSEEDLLQCLLLVARIHLATFRQVTAEKANYEADRVERERWYDFREELVHFQDDLRAFSRYVKREFDMSVLPEPLQKTLEDQEDLLAEAQALETLLRDLMQANVGVQSLKESRMSMEEGKRNKLRKTEAYCNM